MSRFQKSSIIPLRSMLFTLARHCSQSLKISLWRPHWITLSPVSYFTSYSLSVMNKYSADIWLQLISKPWKIKRRMHRGGEMGIVSSVVRFSTFSSPFYRTQWARTRFEPCLRNFLIDRREKEQTWETGPGSIWELMRRKRETEGYWIYKMATGILPPYRSPFYLMILRFRYSLNGLVNRTSFLPSFVPFSRNEKNIAVKGILLCVTDRKIKKITLKNMHKFKTSWKVLPLLTLELSNYNIMCIYNIHIAMQVIYKNV